MTWAQTAMLDRYSLVMVQEFYATYVAIILHGLPKGPLEQPRLREVLVKGWWVDISEEMIHHVLFGPTYGAPRSRAEFDHILRQIRTTTISKAIVQRTQQL